MSNSGSYLTEFREAKNDIQNIFKEIDSFSESIGNYMDETLDTENFQRLLPCDREEISKIPVKTKKILEIIARNQMKCAFFGRTSNGKSTTINAMLGARILPSGIGHTTSCFVLIQGIDSDTGYLLQDGVQTPLSVIGNKASALSSTKLSSDSLIKVFVPNKDSNLLKDEVQLLDSPGINVNPDLDEWIDSFCMDADVFILVANSESTLMQTEKDFFHKVSSKISKPNIFILNNRWDASANEEEFVEEVKSQHLERCVGFLADELKVCSKEEAVSRVFFVSAREVLANRIKNNTSNNSSTNSPAGLPMFPKWEERLFEFENFERQFEKILSTSATRTKFYSHVKEGLTILDDINLKMKSLNENSKTENKAAQIVATHLNEELNKLVESQSGTNFDKITLGIAKLGSYAESIVNASLESEIKMIRHTIDNFNGHEFSTDVRVLSSYKRSISEHVEQIVNQRMGTDCSEKITQRMFQAKSQLCDFYIQYTTDEELITRLKEHVTKLPFEGKFHFDCRNLSSDFEEDLEFHFSLNPTHFFKILKSDKVVAMMSQFQRLCPSVVGSNTFAGAIIIGLLMKVSGWRLISFFSICYGTIYGYERISWTNSAKQSNFKRQYADHICRKVKLVANITSSHFRHQVEEEFDRSWKAIRKDIEGHISVLSKKQQDLERDLAKLENISIKSFYFMDMSQNIKKHLNKFTQTYIDKK